MAACCDCNVASTCMYLCAFRDATWVDNHGQLWSYTRFAELRRDQGTNCEPNSFKQIFAKLSDGLKEYIHDGTLVASTNYFSFSGDLSSFGERYYNKSASSMIETLEFATDKGEAAVKNAVTQALAVIADQTSPDFEMYLTGQTAVRLQATQEAGKLIGMADGTGMILIVLLFGWQVRSWRLTLVPVFNTVLCLFITEGLVYALSKPGIIVLPSFVPNVCLFLSIALSVDYSFFHLSRFQEVRKEGNDVVESVEEMVRTAGRVVLVSGVVLLFTWLALVAFPVFGVNSLGYCSAITIFVCIFVNMLMNPAIILAFPVFFSRAAQDPWHCCRRRQASDVVITAAPLTGESLSNDETKNCYGAVAKCIVKAPWMFIVPIIVFALLTPAVVALFTSDFTVGGISGSTADSDKAKQAILRDFPGSMGGVPLTILLSAPPGQSVKHEEYFGQGCLLAQDLQHAISIPMSDFRGIMLPPCSHWADVEKTLIPGSRSGYSWQKSVNPSNTSTLITVSLPFDAFSDKAKLLVKQGRSAIDKYKSSSGGYGGTVALFHPMSIEVDAEELTWARFPIVIAITLVVVFSVIAFRYGAALIPLKLFFTIALPILSVLGTGVFVFQDGALNWTGIPSLKSSGGLVWINPVACSFMLIGFALDYDIFLFSRIYADRKSGRFTEDEPAIINAVAKTGPIITTAGVIMALAFSGMVVQSSNSFLCQMGFTMIYGILVDTFVVRTLLVPAFLSMAGRFNWWPGKMPRKDGFDSQQVSMQGPSFGA